MPVTTWLTAVPAAIAVSGAGLTSPAWISPVAWTQGGEGPQPVVLATRDGDASTRAHLLARYGFPSTETLQQEQVSCEELLAETVKSGGSGAAGDTALFAEQKWARLSLVMILRGLDLVDNHAAATEHFSLFVYVFCCLVLVLVLGTNSSLCRLRERDSGRRGYYDDELSRFACERALVTAPSFPPTGHLDLSNASLTLLQATQHWVLLRSLDLSHNRLASLAGLRFLTNVQELNLDHNGITAVSPSDVAGCWRWAGLVFLFDAIICRVCRVAMPEATVPAPQRAERCAVCQRPCCAADRHCTCTHWQRRVRRHRVCGHLGAPRLALDYLS
jgi:hypothetical protein